MAQVILNISTPNDGLGDPLRTAFDEQNGMNTELYTTKVDKETGKGLSTNDFTDLAETKLDGIAAGAEVNVQPDWLQADNTQDDFIKNKPTFPFIPEFFQDRIIALGDAVLVGNDVTFSIGYIWDIDNTVYQNASAIIRTIPDATVAFYRTDVAYLDTNNDILIALGTEGASVIPEPAIPIDTLRLMAFNVFGAVITPEPTTFVTTFTELTDTPSTYVGQATKKVVVKSDESGLEFVADTSGGAPTLQEVLTEGNYLTKTKAEIDTLILADELIPLMTYEITGVDTDLYGGSTIYLQAINGNTLEFDGVGKFFNPKYDKAINGFGIWKDYNSYAVNDTVIWGGKLWNNLTGAVGSSLDIFNLDATNWQVIGFNDTDYNIAYDEIKYDYVNDLIVYRNEQNSNIVSTNKNNIDFWISIFVYSPIKVFQWGNVLDFNLDKGIGNQNISNSYNENINFKGSYQSNLAFDNNSYQNNLTFDNSSYQSNLTFNNNSYQNNLTFDNSSFQGNLTFDNNSAQFNLTFDNYSSQSNLTFDNYSSQGNLTFDNSSSQGNLTFDNNSAQFNLTFDNNSDQFNLTFDNNSAQFNLTFDNYSSQSNLTFDNSSQQYNLTEITGKQQSNITFDNIQVDRAATPMVANEIGLNFKGTLPTSTAPDFFLVKEGNQVKEIAYSIPSAITIDTTIIYGSTNPPDGNAVFDALATKVDKNTAISGSTKTKITYDAKGLVTAGADASLAELTDDVTHRTVTDAQIASWNATIGGSASALQGLIDEAILFDDFIFPPAGNKFNLYNTTLTENYPNRTNQQGVIELVTSSASSPNNEAVIVTDGNINYKKQYYGNGSIFTWEAYVCFSHLSGTSGETEYYMLGMQGNLFTSTSNNAIGNLFMYDRSGFFNGGGSVNFQTLTRNSGFELQNTGIPIVAGQWYKLKMVVNATNTDVKFYIDNVLVTTHTTVATFLPHGYLTITSRKPTGSAERKLFVDYTGTATTRN